MKVDNDEDVRCELLFGSETSFLQWLLACWLKQKGIGIKDGETNDKFPFITKLLGDEKKRPAIIAAHREISHPNECKGPVNCRAVNGTKVGQSEIAALKFMKNLPG